MGTLFTMRRGTTRLQYGSLSEILTLELNWESERTLMNIEHSQTNTLTICEHSTVKFIF